MSIRRVLCHPVEACALLLMAALLLFVRMPPGHAAPVGAEVTEFPGFNGEFPSKHYAG
jgi:serine carboxypeptidase-like clade 1